MLENDHGRASLREKVCYGMGGIAYCLEAGVITSYLMLFCTDVLVIDVTIIGILMSSMKILDGITDIVVTSIADRTGKYRRWLLFGIPAAITLILLFWNPAFLETSKAKSLWVCAMYILLVPIFETCIACPYFAMNVTLSEHPKDRLHFSMSRSLGESGSVLLVSILAMPLILTFGTSYKDIAGWRAMACIMGAIIVACALIGFFGTKERVIADNKNDDGTNMKLKDKFNLVCRHAAFWKTIGITVIFMFHYYLSMSLFSHYCIYVLGNSEWVSPLSSIGFAFMVIITGMVLVVGEKLKKRTILIVGCIALVISDFLLFFAHSFPAAIAYEVFLGIGNGILNSVGLSLLPDLSDYIEWKSGKIIPGMISAFTTFAFKVAGAVSVLLASQVLNWSGYDGTLLVQSEHTTQMIRVITPVGSLIFVLLTLITCISLRELNPEKLVMYRKEINARKSCQ